MNVSPKALIIVVSAPSGSGKTTIVGELIKKIPGIKRSVSYTTREARPGEKDGKDYFFITDREFNRKLSNNEFIEWEENFGNFYGTSKEQIYKAQQEDIDIVLSIDVRGAASVREEFPEAISVFIMPPSFDELEKRLQGRNTDTKQVVKERLDEAEREMKASEEFDYLLVNDKLEKAVEELIEIVEKERNNRKIKKGEDHGKSRKR